ncbi:MAG: FAD-binding oxidoreductase [Fimbriimonadaceae bacterium]
MSSDPVSVQPESLKEFSEAARDAGMIASRGNDLSASDFRLPSLWKGHGSAVQYYWEHPDDGSFWGGGDVVEHMDVELAGLKDMAQAGATILSTEGYRGIFDINTNDQVAHVAAGCRLADLNHALSEHGHCIPALWGTYRRSDLWDGVDDSIGWAIALNLPHSLLAQCGSWRDWVLETTMLLADGTIARSGSGAVKNVAGYDVQKLVVGARESLAITLEVRLKILPLSSMPNPRMEVKLNAQEIARRQGELRSTGWWIQRTRASDWPDLLLASDHAAAAVDHAGHVLYGLVAPEENLSRFDGDWVIRSGCGQRNLEWNDSAQVHLMKRAKDIFDPTHKLNPGEMGIF